MEKPQLFLRALQLLFIIILTGLIGNVIATNIRAAGSATAAINFSMFVVVLSWLAAIIGLAASFVDRLAIPVLTLGLDAAATLFTFLAAVVLSAKLGVVNCGGDLGDHAWDWIAYGTDNDGRRCREVQAAAVFMWFLFITFTAGLTIAFLSFRRAGGSVSVRSGPTMSQVRV